MTNEHKNPPQADAAPDRCYAPGCHQWDGTSTCTCAAIAAGGAQEPIGYFQRVKFGVATICEQVPAAHKNDSDVFPLYAAPLPRVAETAPLTVWQPDAPSIPEATCREFIIAVRRDQSKPAGKVAVFSATYANKFTDDGCLSDRNGDEFVADGWYLCGLDMSGEFNEVYEPISLNEGDEIVGWQPLPEWSDLASPAADSQDQRPCTSCDGSGSYHRADGEYMGECPNCAADSQDERAALEQQIRRMRLDVRRGDTVFRCGFNGAIESVLKLLEARAASTSANVAQGAEAEFKNFHRLLCERFAYVHDEAYWKRDQLSLIEHIAAKQSAEAVTLTASQREKLEQLADVRFTRPLDGWDKHVLRKLLERTSARKEPGRTLTEEQLEELEEARDILENMLSSIEADGNYSTEATCTFLRQALLCLRPVVMCLSRIDAAPPAQPALPDDARAASQPDAAAAAAHAGATDLATQIARMRKDETRGDPTLRLGFNSAIDVVLRLLAAVPTPVADTCARAVAMGNAHKERGRELCECKIGQCKAAAKPVSAAAAKEGALIDAERWRRARRHGILKHGDPFSTTFVCNEDADAYVDTLLTTPTTTTSADAEDADEFLHPATQVFFRAGLVACREYMARFVEHESPTIAASIRANWWPSLGQDFGAPRKLNWNEMTEGEFGEPGFRVRTKDEVSPTQEALPIALEFLLSLDPGNQS